jgi:hypothetical protein
VVDYCEKNTLSGYLVSDELNICKEMVALLPVKMEKIRQEAEL